MEKKDEINQTAENQTNTLNALGNDNAPGLTQAKQALLDNLKQSQDPYQTLLLDPADTTLTEEKLNKHKEDLEKLIQSSDQEPTLSEKEQQDYINKLNEAYNSVQQAIPSDDLQKPSDEKDSADEESNEQQKSSTLDAFKQEVSKDDDPMVALLKEYFNLLIELQQTTFNFGKNAGKEQTVNILPNKGEEPNIQAESSDNENKSAPTTPEPTTITLNAPTTTNTAITSTPTLTSPQSSTPTANTSSVNSTVDSTPTLTTSQSTTAQPSTTPGLTEQNTPGLTGKK